MRIICIKNVCGQNNVFIFDLRQLLNLDVESKCWLVGAKFENMEIQWDKGL